MQTRETGALILGLFAAFSALSALADEEPTESRLATEVQTEVEVEAREAAPQTNDQFMLITEPEFVPFSQYLGIPDVNNLPPTSVGQASQP
jgi:hypothetical protein